MRENSAHELLEEIRNIKIEIGIENGLIEKKLRSLARYNIKNKMQARRAIDDLQKELTGLEAEHSILLRRASNIIYPKKD